MSGLLNFIVQTPKISASWAPSFQDIESARKKSLRFFPILRVQVSRLDLFSANMFDYAKLYSTAGNVLEIWVKIKWKLLDTYTVKKLSIFLSPAGISVTKLPLAGNNLFIPGQGKFG